MKRYLLATERLTQKATLPTRSEEAQYSVGCTYGGTDYRCGKRRMLWERNVICCCRAASPCCSGSPAPVSCCADIFSTFWPVLTTDRAGFCLCGSATRCQVNVVASGRTNCELQAATSCSGDVRSRNSIYLLRAPTLAGTPDMEFMISFSECDEQAD